MAYELSLRGLAAKNIYPLGEDFRGRSKDGTELSFTNYYMEKNGKPFFGVSGEFHYSRMSDGRWEDELVKMKMGGINVVSTYVFWIHHEEEEGIFRFDGCRNLRKFVGLCQKHGLYVILRVGPFDHGEARNGGIPDWMYGKPFEVRSLNEGFLNCVRRLYAKLAQQVEGMFFQNNGPIIGVQIDNEYMHSSAPWEITTGISNEWVFGGNEGNDYMLGLKELASECGLLPVFYTCTGWGGAAAPDSMLPLWGGYAFRPWMFYSYKGEHPATEEYVYQDYHNNDFVCTGDFKPAYKPEEKPYSCCEMGGGMMCSYYYRFRYPYKSVDAMANIKMASGCNFLGYYMFQGGSNPLGRHGQFMNEGQVPRISYDYQAALGEFGQVRESYRRLKSVHYFVQRFGERICALKTVLPEGAQRIAPKDGKTLRYAVRTDGKRGFLFLNNYQDHFSLPDRENEDLALHLDQEDLTWRIGIAGDENAILPFHFDMDGIDLVKANAQVVTRTVINGEITYVFFVPDGMKGGFVFEDGAEINGVCEHTYCCGENRETEFFHVKKNDSEFDVLVLNRKMADNMYLLCDGSLVFTEAVLLEDENGIRLESVEASNVIYAYPAERFAGEETVRRMENDRAEYLGAYLAETKERRIEVDVKQVAASRYTIGIPENFLDGLKDARLLIEYTGDIGNAFLNGRMINDNFANGAKWEIGLKDFAGELKKNRITLYIVPLKEGVNVKVDSAMAARREEAEVSAAQLWSVRVQPVYEINI
jgi:hypothetical protein